MMCPSARGTRHRHGRGGRRGLPVVPLSPLSPDLQRAHGHALQPVLAPVASAFGEDLDTSRRIDDGADQRPIGVELLNVSTGVNLADLPDPDEIARLLAAEGVRVLTVPAR